MGGVTGSRRGRACAALCTEVMTMRLSNSLGLVLIAILVMTSTSGCSTVSHPPLKIMDHVDLQRFMGDWHVIANIPTSIEKDAYNPVESYRMNDDGTIATTFTFNKGGFSGPVKQYHPRGFV